MIQRWESMVEVGAWKTVLNHVGREHWIGVCLIKVNHFWCRDVCMLLKEQQDSNISVQTRRVKPRKSENVLNLVVRLGLSCEADDAVESTTRQSVNEDFSGWSIDPDMALRKAKNSILEGCKRLMVILD